MSTSPSSYFRPEDYPACKELRESYLAEADRDLFRAMLAICIDMVALDAYATDLENLARRHGVDLAEMGGSRPRSPLPAFIRSLSLEA